MSFPELEAVLPDQENVSSRTGIHYWEGAVRVKGSGVGRGFVELTGYDADGAVVEMFDASFEDISTQVFDDGYATVGYRSDPKVVTAQVRVGWFSSPDFSEKIKINENSTALDSNSCA